MENFIPSPIESTSTHPYLTWALWSLIMDHWQSIVAFNAGSHSGNHAGCSHQGGLKLADDKNTVDDRAVRSLLLLHTVKCNAELLLSCYNSWL